MQAHIELMRAAMTASRRRFLSNFGMGMGAIGLATLLGPELRGDESSAGESSAAFAPRPHFPAKAKRVLHIFAQGAPSHVDTWDPKPALTSYDGRVVEQLDGVAFASPFKFSKR